MLLRKDEIDCNIVKRGKGQFVVLVWGSMYNYYSLGSSFEVVLLSHYTLVLHVISKFVLRKGKGRNGIQRY